ncbi:Ger(x)C family spore germination protein [Ammoniphilus sp. 3BR4]|uniref:Ger(x)C family spore germination protein n=1 Tax=Ammoniphilus sp. 3BR4 TaxID=3158265 RepID=UPI003467A374
MSNLWKKTIQVWCVLVLIFPFLTGCWDRLEIEERAVILGMAIDTAGEEEVKEEKKVTHLKEDFPKPTTGKIRLTAQIAIQGRIPLGPGEGGGGGGGQKKPVWVLHAVGDTIDDAIMVLQQQIAYRLFIGHLRVVVISEEIAKKGVQNINDYFRRNSEIRRTVWMMVSQGDADKAMLTVPPLERIPTLYLMETMNQSVKLGKLPPSFLGLFWSASSAHGREPFLPYIEVKEDNIFVQGLAYFRGDKMVGRTEPLQIAIVMQLLGVETAGYSVLITVPEDPSPGAIMTQGTSRKAKIRSEIRNGRPHFNIQVHIEADIVEKSNEQFDVNKPGMIAKIEKEIAEKQEKSQAKLIKQTQEKGSDIFGFGEYVRAKHPDYWNEHIKTKEKWREMYKEATFESQVNISIRRVGMKAQ